MPLFLFQEKRRTLGVKGPNERYKSDTCQIMPLRREKRSQTFQIDSSGTPFGSISNPRRLEEISSATWVITRRVLKSAWLWKVTLVPLFLWFLFRVYSAVLGVSDPFDQPFCDASGTCHERPDVASPRTVYSAWDKKQFDLWWKYYGELIDRVDAYAKKRQKLYENNKKLNHDHRTRPLILLGDSITESWSETGLGIHKHRAEGVASVLETELSASFGLDPIVLGEAGDQTQHLLYRLENGHMKAAELSSSDDSGQTSFYDPSAIFVVMIGTNNLGSGELPGPTTKGILAVAEYLLRETDEAGCNVLLFGLLPRGDGRKVLPKLCPPRCSDEATNTPYSSFLPPIRSVNEALSTEVEALAKTYPAAAEAASPRIRLVDCGSGFLNPSYDNETAYGVGGNYEVLHDLMPDLLHPSVQGHQILAECIRDYIGQIDG